MWVWVWVRKHIIGVMVCLCIVVLIEVPSNSNRTTVLEAQTNAHSQYAQSHLHTHRAKEYTEAIERYTISLGYRPGNAALHANRAATYIKLKVGVRSNAARMCRGCNVIS